jgi:hypothetical protein
MRSLLCMPLLAILAAAQPPPAAAQAARASVEASVSVVDPAQVHMDAPAAAVRAVAGGVELSVPLRTSGTSEPVVMVRQDDAEGVCETVAPPAAGAARGLSLRCFVPQHAVQAGGVTTIPVTLFVVPAT